MSLAIIGAEERLKEKNGCKIVVCGESGVGKTSLLKTLDEKTTFFIDLEAGDQSVQELKNLKGSRPTTWQDCRDLAVIIGGPNPSVKDNEHYSQQHYDTLMASYGSMAEEMQKFQTYFVDSITVAARLCFKWCSNQEINYTKSGALELRQVYGHHAREMMTWLIHLQHMRQKNVIFVGILDRKLDAAERPIYELQIEGGKTSRELPGIVDQVITMASLKLQDDTELKRYFVCSPLNKDGFPAKDRSGKLAIIEEPHLGNIISKINGNLINEKSQQTTKGVIV